MQTFKDKIISLTGGSEGIGYECAKAYVVEGEGGNCRIKRKPDKRSGR